MHLQWTPVSDPESGIYRYHLYRDGFMLAELFDATSSFDDPGFVPESVNEYELRAVNGAFQESASCPIHAWSTRTGDANGDGVLDALDLFFLINHFYDGGPAPVGAEAEPDPAAAERLPVTAPLPADELTLGSAAAVPGALIEVPIYLRDVSGTPLGIDQSAGQRIQGLSMSIEYTPASALTSISFERAGITEGLPALFEDSLLSGNRVSWIASFHEDAAPLPLDLDAPAPGNLVGRLRIRVDPGAAPGSSIDLAFSAATTLASNQAGTLGEAAALGGLLLGTSSIQVIDCAAAGDVALPHQTIDFPLVCTAGGTITAGPGLVIVPPGDLTLRAGVAVILTEGFRAASAVRVELDSPPEP